MDKYDEAIDYLTQNPGQIYDAWVDCTKHRSGCLFTFVTGGNGCLTMIHGSPEYYNGGEWHDEIVADERIPEDGEYIKVKDLPVFAEWQRKIHEHVKS